MPDKKTVSKFMPGYTYEFSWNDGSVYKGVFVRLNRKLSGTLLFKDVTVGGTSKAWPCRDDELSGHSWINNFSSQGLLGVWEIAEPVNNKPTFDKSDWVANLFYSSLPRHGMDVCPKCGSEGKWIRMALICPTHGLVGGC